MEKENLEINENDTYVNQDVETIQALEARFNAELAKKDAKYSALLKYATEGGRISAEKPQEPTPAEKKAHIEDIAREVRDNKINGLEQAKRLIEYDDYVTENGGRTIFTFTDSTETPTMQDLDSANKVKSLLQYAIEKSEGSEEIFKATVVDKLRDIK